MRPGGVKTIGIWLAWWVFLFAVWMALVATNARAEILAGIAVAAIAATGAEVVRRSRVVQLHPWGLLPRKPWWLPGAVVKETWQLTVLLSRQLRVPQDNLGAFRGIAFDAGPDNDPRAAARRAAYTAIISFSPNTYVIGIDREKKNMLVHELIVGPRETTSERVLGKL
jgi:multisubunit Na+/H+ antiporter MnhE subunit